MKKVTLFCMLLTGMLTYSQIDINEDFESYESGTQPSGWTGDFETTSTFNNSSFFRCGSRSFYTGSTSASTKIFTTENLSEATTAADATVTFNYKIVAMNLSTGVKIAPAENWGTFVFEYTTNGTDWIEIGSINDDNYTYNEECHSASYTIDAASLPIGSDFKFRGSFNLENVAPVTFVYASIDDLVISQSNSLSNAEVNFEGFRYYPNPVKNTLTFESPNMVSSVAIYNVVGQKVVATAGNNTMTTVNMSALPNGIYFAKVTIDGTEKTIKIIKE
ncbi:T9SS type A sorting domain-containing protein [Mangrovimonas sp. YM274]|uniref:T9SS type A sorting domain-containing protein n=1 Tax=Mangrovimonas sp. YM274 TaxID=3070660 RepID=UPI0027DD4AE5|nr:T9SS type A sorting domain-containing protein [Mangrovimonas sp. YM274]WMI69185.1 T9SS type A sorting domain-containing protein [Mangrovimonas sp. YM274]WMI69186.1 T9SS type A sorting domain-containing protein [Mangrovimonas sp. YM274]